MEPLPRFVGEGSGAGMIETLIELQEEHDEADVVAQGWQDLMKLWLPTTIKKEDELQLVNIFMPVCQLCNYVSDRQ